MPDTLQSSPAAAVLDPRVDPENDIAMEMVQPDPSAAPTPAVVEPSAADADATHVGATGASAADTDASQDENAVERERRTGT